MNSYRRIQVIAGIYLLIYIAALYFSTGVQVGLRVKKLFSILILVSCLIVLGITRFNVVSFNEAFWYFILFVRYIPFIVLIETIIFIFDLDWANQALMSIQLIRAWSFIILKPGYAELLAGVSLYGNYANLRR